MTELLQETRNCAYWNEETATQMCTGAGEFEGAFSLLSNLQEKGKCCGFGKPYKLGENFFNETSGNVEKTSGQDGLGCVRNSKTDSLIPSGSNGQLQQCYGYSMQQEGNALPEATFPGKCAPLV